MSEPKLISPMLDNFSIGEAISNHHGIACYPAMPNDSDSRYIVKIISIPASQVQLQALLLTGAYQSEDSAREYFHDLAKGIVAETEILTKLSKLEGFLPVEGCQIVPKEGEVIHYEIENDLFPTIYRIDRIKEYCITDEHFRVPYEKRFEEGEFRKRIQFMYSGRLQKIKFWYKGKSIEAVLDRLPTAKVIEENETGYLVSAEVFGEGLDIWLRSHGEAVEVVSRI